MAGHIRIQQCLESHLGLSVMQPLSLHCTRLFPKSPLPPGGRSIVVETTLENAIAMLSTRIHAFVDVWKSSLLGLCWLSAFVCPSNYSVPKLSNRHTVLMRGTDRSPCETIEVIRPRTPNLSTEWVGQLTACSFDA